VPAGNRNNNGAQFGGRGTNVNYWSSSVSSSANAWRRNFDYNNAQVNRNNSNRSNGFSVRCVRESKGTSAKETDFLLQFRIFAGKSVLLTFCAYRPESEKVTAIPSAPIESGNPPNSHLGKNAVRVDKKPAPVQSGYFLYIDRFRRGACRQPQL
jgi:hypothetical protein